MNSFQLMEAGFDLGYDISLTIESDGSMWTGTDDTRKYLTTAQVSTISNRAEELETERVASKQAVLNKLGLTADEIAALLS